MRVPQDLHITGARTFCSRVGEPANPAVVEENGLTHIQIKMGVLVYILIPHLVLPQHLLLVQSEEGLEDGAEGLEGAEEVCLPVRESGHRGLKAEARLPLLQ